MSNIVVLPLILRKIVMQLFLPPGGIIVFVLLICLFFLLNRKKIAIFLATVLIFTLFLLSSWLGEYTILKPLEDDYASFKDAYSNNISLSNPIIVVLGGGVVDNSLSRQSGGTDIGEVTLARLYGAYTVYREIKCPILVSGGNVPGYTGNTPAAQIMQEVLVNMGVPLDIIYQEDKSRTTLENASYAMEKIIAQGYNEIILVSSALHMRRSVEVFKMRNSGVIVIPAPVNYLFENTRPGLLNILPNQISWNHNLRAIHEWIGLFYYRLLHLLSHIKHQTPVW